MHLAAIPMTDDWLGGIISPEISQMTVTHFMYKKNLRRIRRRACVSLRLYDDYSKTLDTSPALLMRNLNIQLSLIRIHEDEWTIKQLHCMIVYVAVGQFSSSINLSVFPSAKDPKMFLSPSLVFGKLKFQVKQYAGLWASCVLFHSPPRTTAVTICRVAVLSCVEAVGGEPSVRGVYAGGGETHPSQPGLLPRSHLISPSPLLLQTAWGRIFILPHTFGAGGTENKNTPGRSILSGRLQW